MTVTMVAMGKRAPEPEPEPEPPLVGGDGAAAEALQAQAETATLAYSQDNEVGEELALVDGFYDCGRGWGPTMENIGVRALLQLFEREGSVRGREVVLLDARSDASLLLFRQRVLRQLSEFAERKGCSALKLGALLAKLVAERLGGHGSVAGARAASGSAADVARVRAANGGSDIIPLGSVRLGVCRHRSSLFKYLADAFAASSSETIPEALRLRTRLVRGRFDGNNRSVGHAWNLVWSPKHKAWFVIDVMHDPNAAFEEDSDEALKYNSVAIEQSSRRSTAAETEALGKEHMPPARVCAESVAALGTKRLVEGKTLRTKHADQSWLCPKHRRAAASGASRPQSFLFCPGCFRRKTKIEQEREGEEALFSGPEVASNVLGRHVLQAPLQTPTAWWAAAADGLHNPPGDGPHRASRGPPQRSRARRPGKKSNWLEARAIHPWDVKAGAVLSEDCLFEAGDILWVVEGGYKSEEELRAEREAQEAAEKQAAEDIYWGTTPAKSDPPGEEGKENKEDDTKEKDKENAAQKKEGERKDAEKAIEWYWGSLTSPEDFADGADRRVGLLPAAYIELLAAAAATEEPQAAAAAATVGNNE